MNKKTIEAIKSIFNDINATYQQHLEEIDKKKLEADLKEIGEEQLEVDLKKLEEKLIKIINEEKIDVTESFSIKVAEKEKKPTVFFEAARYGLASVLDTCLANKTPEEKSALLQAKDEGGNTAFMLAAEGKGYPGQTPALAKYPDRKGAEAIKSLLKAANEIKGFKLKIDMGNNNKNTALHQAAYFGRLKCFSEILENVCGKNKLTSSYNLIAKKNRLGESALHIAIRGQRPKIVEHIFKLPTKQDDKNFLNIVNQKNRKDRTILGQAIFEAFKKDGGNGEVLKYLLDKFREINLLLPMIKDVDKEGKLLFYPQGNEKSIQLFLNYLQKNYLSKFEGIKTGFLNKAKSQIEELPKRKQELEQELEFKTDEKDKKSIEKKLAEIDRQLKEANESLNILENYNITASKNDTVVETVSRSTSPASPTIRAGLTFFDPEGTTREGTYQQQGQFSSPSNSY